MSDVKDRTSYFRETFESFDTDAPGARWSKNIDPTSSDLVFADGNTGSASYLVISKCPLVAGTQTDVMTLGTFSVPLDVTVGLSMSQNTLGQEISLELIDPDGTLADIADIEIAAISQAASVLTVDTVTPHGLVPGKAVGIAGCSVQQLNHPAVVVATIPSPTQFTVTAGPMGTIVSQSVSNPVGAKGKVFFRERFGRAKNGVAQIFENASATNASLYVRSDAGDSLPSGTIAGNHSITVGTRASAQLVNTKDAFAFTASTEYRISAAADRVQWSDAPVDTTAQASNRLVRSQVTLPQLPRYRLRFRSNNSKALTVPSAQIVSATKTGTTTATVVTDRAHGLLPGDFITAYGARDQANFANLTAATAVASIVDDFTFTIVWGAAVTAQTFGGYISRPNAGNLPSALGANVVVAQSAVLTTRVDGTRELTLTGNTNWGGLLIGDLVELLGVRDAVAGAPIGVDGTWKVANFATTTLTLVLPYSGQREVIPDFALVNCGGGIIKRTDVRISFVRIVDVDKRVEGTPRPANDAGGAAPVTVQNTVTVAGSVTATVASTAVAGTVANDSAAGNPVTVGYVARNANPTPVNAAGDAVNSMATMLGVPIVKPYAIPEAEWAFTGALTTTSDVAVQAAAGLGLKRHVTWVQATNTGASAIDVLLRDATTTRLQFTVPAGASVDFALPTGIPTTANAILNVALSAAGTVRFNALGYTAP